MEIKGINGLSIDDIRREVASGAKFVSYSYCISIIIMTFRRPSDIYFIKSKESAIKHGWPYLTISFFFGWWGIPWGPVYTLGSIFGAFSGKNLTSQVMNELESKHATSNLSIDWSNINQQSN